MSDALLTEISKKLSDIHAALKGGAAPAAASKPAAAAAPAPKGDANAIAADTTKTAAEKKAAADKAIAARKAEKAAAATPTAAPAKPVGPAGGTKAPGGKHTIDQVRAIIRQVSAKVDLQSAKDILQDDGGVEKVSELKPENYDKVYEACEVLLNGEGGAAAPAAEPEDDLM